MKKLVIAILLSTLALSGSVLAAPPADVQSDTGVRSDEMVRQDSLEKLNTTAEQKEKMKSIQRIKRDKLKDALLTWREDERIIIQTENFDETKANEFIENNESRDKQQALIRLKAKNAMYNVLTVEQKTQLKNGKDKLKQSIKEKKALSH